MAIVNVKKACHTLPATVVLSKYGMCVGSRGRNLPRLCPCEAGIIGEAGAIYFRLSSAKRCGQRAGRKARHPISHWAFLQQLAAADDQWHCLVRLWKLISHGGTGHQHVRQGKGQNFWRLRRVAQICLLATTPYSLLSFG